MKAGKRGCSSPFFPSPRHKMSILLPGFCQWSPAAISYQSPSRSDRAEKIGKDQEWSIPFSTEHSAPTPGCPRGSSAPGKIRQKQRENVPELPAAHFSGSGIIAVRIPNGHRGADWNQHGPGNTRARQFPSFLNGFVFFLVGSKVSGWFYVFFLAGSVSPWGSRRGPSQHQRANSSRARCCHLYPL